ncbi:MAG: SDR family NAD(P)-dependent oxidoreductase [Chloroflexi bacterium]|nr:SDR family NAD(P)-dependent oxidoreductase [Chloroflexota bacterium]
MSRLEGQIAVVTGAARGLGRSHALALAVAGADVALVDICRTPGAATYELASDRDLEEAVEQVKAQGRQALGVNCDVTDVQDVKQMVDGVLERWGKIDILVNNAGVTSVSSVVEMRDSEWDLVVDVSLKGTFLCCRRVVAHMMQRKGGRVINTGSIAGRDGIPLNAHYSATKAAVHAFTQALAKETASYGVNVNAVAPGGVNTRMMQALSARLAALWGVKPEQAYEVFCQRFHTSAREITPEDVSNLVVWLASEETRNMTGQIIYI